MGKICVNCRTPVKDLYKTYENSSNVIKIRECGQCNEIADKYIEAEQISVVIDVALLNSGAYRHILFNTDFQKYWKYSIILICIEAYLSWNNNHATSDHPALSNGDEKGFYVSGLIVLAEHVLLFSLIYGLVRMFNTKEIPSIPLLWKALTLANFSKLLLVPVMIWRESSLWELGINYMLIFCYSILSLICALSVVSQLSRIRTTFIILTAMLVRRLCMDHLSPFIGTTLN